MKKGSLTEMDLTNGNLFWKIPLFVLPMALTTIFQLLYTTIDLWTVSKFGGGSSSMAAVGSNSALINLVIVVFLNLSLGANVVMANAKGMGNKEKAENVLHTSFVLALIFGVVVGAIGYFIIPFLLKAMGTIPAILGKATTYLQIYFLGLPFLMIYNYGSQLLRALGDSNKPLFILIVSGAINVIFDLLFVIVFKWDVAGVAWATFISEAISAILTIVLFVFNKNGYVRLSFKKLKIDRICLKELIRIGLPAGIQGFCFSLPNVLIQSSLYTITNYSINGEIIDINDVVSGSAASAQIEGYIFAFISAMSGGTLAFVGQNYGAGKKNNIRKVFWYSQIWNLIFMVILGGICFIIPDTLLSIFITPGEGTNLRNAIMAGKQRLFIFAALYILDAIMDTEGSYLRGMKYSLPPAIVVFLGCTVFRIIFVLWVFPLEQFHTIYYLYATFPISWAIIDLAYIPIILILEKKAFAKIDARYKKEEAIETNSPSNN